MNWIEPYINEYISFLRKNTFINEKTGTDWVSISTPMLDNQNDAIEIYARMDGDKIVLSDDGYTLNTLKTYGVEFNRPGRKKELLDHILAVYGIQLEKNELITTATAKSFPQKKLNLLQAISETNDLYVLSKPHVTNLFWEDVEAYFVSHNIVHTPNFIARGISGLEFNFDFQIATLKKEILIKTFPNLLQGPIVNFLYGWADVKEARAKQSRKQVESIAIINDMAKEPKKELVEALSNKGSSILYWSKRDEDEALALLN